MNPRWRRIGVPVLLIAFVSVSVGIATAMIQRGSGSLVQRADRLAGMGKLEAAEKLYWKALHSEEADLKVAISFIDAHVAMQEFAEMDIAAAPIDTRPSPIIDSAIEEYLAGDTLRGPDMLLARFWWQARAGREDADGRAVKELANAEPPPRWANHLLARYGN